MYLSNTNYLQSTVLKSSLRGAAPTPVPPVPPAPSGSLNYFNGLGRTTYSGSIFITALQDPNAFATASVSQSVRLDSGSLIPLFTALPPGTASADYKFSEWLGYFKASTNETYTFYLRTDDESAMWFGNDATASYLTTGSALILEPALPPTPSSGSIVLISGSYYPMRIQYSSGIGDFFSSSFSTPTISETQDYTGYTFANTASLGF